MRHAWILLAVITMLCGCTPTTTPVAAPPDPPPVASAPAPERDPDPEPDPVSDPLEILSGMNLRDLVPDSAGRRFIVQDLEMSLYLVDAHGKRHLGTAPEMGLLAAWGENDYGYAFARKSAAGTGYEIVGVGHEGSKVLAATVGYPGALTFVGQAVHFIDAEGWKAVTWSGAPVLKGPMKLGPRSNQKAWCAWLPGGPRCLGGYWNGGGESELNLTVVGPGEPPLPVVAKGNHPILGFGAISADGRMIAASLGSRSAGAGDRGRIVVAWLDEDGGPTRTKEYPLLTGELAFDGYGRLIAHRYPHDGSGSGSIVILDPEDGGTRLVESVKGPYTFTMAPGGKTIHLLPVGGEAKEVTLDAP